MFARAKRPSRSIFSLRPDRRVAFTYGSIAIYRAQNPGVFVVVSKKVAPRAPDRNRIRRRMYHAVRKVKPTPTVTAVIYPSRAVLTAPFAEIVSSVAESPISR